MNSLYNSDGILNIDFLIKSIKKNRRILATINLLFFVISLLYASTLPIKFSNSALIKLGEYNYLDHSHNISSIVSFNSNSLKKQLEFRFGFGNISAPNEGLIEINVISNSPIGGENQIKEIIKHIENLHNSLKENHLKKYLFEFKHLEELNNSKFFDEQTRKINLDLMNRKQKIEFILKNFWNEEYSLVKEIHKVEISNKKKQLGIVLGTLFLTLFMSFVVLFVKEYLFFIRKG